MAASETEVANLALVSLLGEPPIVSLDDETHRARSAKAIFATTRDDLLCDHTWNFAEVEFTPAAESLGADADGWYRHGLDADCLQITAVEGCGPNDWKVVAPANPSDPTSPQQRVLLARRRAPKVTATWRIVNVGVWSPKFVSTFAARLAEGLAAVVSRDKSDQDRMEDKAKARLTTAKRRDGQEGARQELPRDTSWIAARRRGAR